MVRGNSIRNMVLAVTACALAAACATSIRQVTSTKVLRADDTGCRTRLLIWHSLNIARGCDLTVTYHGSETCPAYLLYTQPSSIGGIPDSSAATNSPPIVFKPGMRTDPAGAASVTVKLRDITDLWISCGSTNESASGCAYSLERINCSRNASEIDPTTVSAAFLTNAVTSCGAASQTIWVTPVTTNAPRGCHVTLRVKGGPHCPATLDGLLANGNTKGYTAGDEWEFISFIDVTKITLTCEGSGGDQCQVEIVQTDCEK